MSTPQFSIVIPTLNRAQVLPVAIRSVLAQTDGDFELLVVDDGSTDDTAAVVAAIDDPRVRYLPQPQTGVCAARNAGAAAARGRFLVFLDSDDELLPNALQSMRALAARDALDVVLAPRVQVTPDRRDWRTLVPEKLGFVPGAFALTADLYAAASGYDEQLRYGENTDFGWRVRRTLDARGGRIGVAAEPSVVIYLRAGRAYDEARYEAARRFLEHPDQLLDTEFAGSLPPRKRRASYQSIAAVAGARLGRRGEALRFAALALKNDPLARARYRTLASVVRTCMSRARPSESGPAETTRAPAPSPTAGAIHGIVVTYNRPQSLARMVDELAHIGLATLTIVDNAPSADSKAVADDASTRIATTYIAMTENTGPAGGYAAGMTRLLDTADDDDWILVLDDDRLTGPKNTARRLRDFGVELLARGAPVGAVGQVGARFDRRGRLTRLRDDELAGPVSVDYVAGGQMLMVRVASVRAVGPFDSDLFFAFDDLDFCQRLRRAGFGVYAYGPAGLAARERFGRLGDGIGRAPRRENPWRRYYSVRNHIVVMRRYTSLPRAAMATLAHLIGRPIADLVRGRGDWSLLVANTRGCIDAWLGRLGRRVEPSGSDVLPV
jgi:GT2 family glycosyltransferase